jgi:hypothetical protein
MWRLETARIEPIDGRRSAPARVLQTQHRQGVIRIMPGAGAPPSFLEIGERTMSKSTSNMTIRELTRALRALRERRPPRAWLTVLALLARQAIEEQGGGVVDPRTGIDVPHAQPDDACPVCPGVSSGLHLADLVGSLGTLQDVLAEDGVYLCVDRQDDGCRLWPGRFPADDEAAILLPFPAPPVAGHPGPPRLRLVA